MSNLKLLLRSSALSFAASAAIGMLPTSASAASPITFVGQGFVTSVSSGCPLFVVGQQFLVIYRPKLSTSDPLPEGILLQIATGGAALLTATDAAKTFQGTASYNTIGLSGLATYYTNSGGGTSSLTFLPASFSASSPYLDVQGTFSNIASAGSISCTVGIRAGLTRHT